MNFEALHDEAKSLRLQVSWSRIKVQVYEGLLGKQYSTFMCVARTLRSWKA